MRPSQPFRDERGTTAVEFAIVGPVFMMLMVGLLYGCMLLFSAVSMTYAVEEGARCASVKKTVCNSNATIIAHTTAAYLGPAITPTFTYSTPACGHAVNGTARFTLHYVFGSATIPLSATSCFP